MTRALLWCGLLSSLLYIANDLAAPALWPGYDHAAQAVSELSARGAPSRPWQVRVLIAYDLLLLAFAFGMAWAGDGRLRLAAALVALVAIVGAVTSLVFPMHLRGHAATFCDQMHIGATVVTVAAIIGAMGLAAASLGGRFRRWSLAAIATTFLFGVFAGMQGPRIDAGLPTPWLGVAERLSIGSYLLWIGYLSITLLQITRSSR